MPDIDHLWGGDINAGPTGDLGLVDGPSLTIQRIVRRLMTRSVMPASADLPEQPAEYIWHNDYGASLPQRIGGAFDFPLISSILTSQILKESAVAPSPAPAFTFTPTTLGTLTVTISYTDKFTGAQKLLSFDVNT
jgi:hypothetical protein